MTVRMQLAHRLAVLQVLRKVLLHVGWLLLHALHHVGVGLLMRPLGKLMRRLSKLGMKLLPLGSALLLLLQLLPLLLMER